MKSNCLTLTLSLAAVFGLFSNCQASEKPNADSAKSVKAGKKEVSGVGSGRASLWSRAVQGGPTVKSAEKLLAKNPKDPNALNDLGYAYRQEGKLDEAEKNLKAALAIKPDLAQAHCNLSVVYFDRKNYESAVAEAREAVKLDADQPVYRVVLGNALSKTKDLKGAVQEYKVAVHLKPGYENAHYNLGRVLLEDGQLTEAKFALAEALMLDPQDDRVYELWEKLGAMGSSSPEADAKAVAPKSESKSGSVTDGSTGNGPAKASVNSKSVETK